MATPDLQASESILRELRSAVDACIVRASAADDQARSAGNQVQSEIAEELARRQEALRNAEAQLTACEREPDWSCAVERRRVAEATARVRAALAAGERADRAMAEHASASSQAADEREAAAGDARTLLDHFARGLRDYSAMAAALGGLAVGGGSVGGGGGVSAPGAMPTGHEVVHLAAIDTSDSGVHGRADFGKGYSPEDLAWAFEALDKVVLPHVEAGRGREFFASLDQQQGLVGTRSYSDTYAGFFGHDAIRLHPRPDGTFEVANGYHRVWVAQRLGRSTVLARVVR